MKFFDSEHAQLAATNHSRVMGWFNSLEFDRKVTIIALSLLLGTLSGAMAFTGKAVSTLRLCLQTPQGRLCKDDNNRPFEMTPAYWEQWEERGRPTQAVVDKLLPATNPYKHLYALGAFLGFGFAGWCFRSLQNSDRKLSQYEEVAEQTALDIAKIKANHEVEMTALDYSVVTQQAEIIGTTEAEITALEAGDMRHEAELAGMSEEERRYYIEYVRNLKTPFLEGMTLEQVNNPGNKVNSGVDQNQLESKFNLNHFYQVGEQILASMLASDKSILISSGTGTGKTTTEHYYLTRYVDKHPNAVIWALLNKNDELPGVTPERRTIFKPELIGTEELENLLNPLFQVYRIYLDRKNKPGSDRNFLKQNYPIRLVLGDWYGTYQELQAQLKKEELQRVLAMIRQIVTIGRDSGVGLVVDTQSANLESLGLANDASIRQSLDIYSQGFIYTEDGTEKGELQSIRLCFSNNAICGSAERKEVAAAYQYLCETIGRGELRQPIIFTSVGATPRIGVVPTL